MKEKPLLDTHREGEREQSMTLKNHQITTEDNRKQRNKELLVSEQYKEGQE